MFGRVLGVVRRLLSEEHWLQVSAEGLLLGLAVLFRLAAVSFLCLHPKYLAATPPRPLGLRCGFELQDLAPYRCVRQGTSCTGASSEPVTFQ